MLSRTVPSVVMLMLALVAFAPAGVPQPIAHVAQDSEGAVVVTIRLPIPDEGFDPTHYEIPTAEGLLLIDLEPILLPGPGGSVDVEAYLAEAKLLLDGKLTELPSLLVLPEEEVITGPVDDAMLELQAQLEELEMALEALSDETTGEAAWAHEMVLGALAQVEWIQAFAEEATGAAYRGVEAQLAIINSVLARIESAMPLLEAFMDGVNQTLAYASPEVPDHVWEKFAFVNETINATALAAQEARDALIAQAQENITAVDEAVDEQGTIDGALVAVQAAYDSLMEEEEEEEEPPEPEEPSELEKTAEETMKRAESEAAGALVKVEELQALVDENVSRSSEEFQNTVDRTLVSLEETLGPMAWALNWTDMARAYADEQVALSLQDANASLTAAIATVEELRGIVQKYHDQQIQPAVDAQLVFADEQLLQAAGRLSAAQEDLEAARAQLEEDIAGGLEPPAEEDPEPEPPAPGEDDTMAMCVEQPTSVVCAEYIEPQAPGDSEELVLSVTIPSIAGLIPAFPPSTDGVVPSVTGPSVPSVTAPTMPSITLPGGPGSPSVSPSVTVTSVTVPSSSSSPTSQAPDAQGEIGFGGMQDSLSLTEGQQESLLVKIRNLGSEADRIHLGAQTDAPVAIDATDASILAQPGQTAEFLLRLTPTSDGVGKLNLVASSENGGAAKHVVTVVVARGQASASEIAASVDPSAIEALVGRQSMITVMLTNHGSAADKIILSAAASAARVEPARLEFVLEPGESAIREIEIVPTEPGQSTVQMKMETDRGGNLEPIVMMDAAEAQSSDADPDPNAPQPSKGRSPGFALPLLVLAVAGVLIVVRRRLQ